MSVFAMSWFGRRFQCWMTSGVPGYSASGNDRLETLILVFF